MAPPPPPRARAAPTAAPSPDASLPAWEPSSLLPPPPSATRDLLVRTFYARYGSAGRGPRLADVAETAAGAVGTSEGEAVCEEVEATLAEVASRAAREELDRTGSLPSVQGLNDRANASQRAPEACQSRSDPSRSPAPLASPARSPFLPAGASSLPKPLHPLLAARLAGSGSSSRPEDSLDAFHSRALRAAARAVRAEVQTVAEASLEASRARSRLRCAQALAALRPAWVDPRQAGVAAALAAEDAHRSAARLLVGTLPGTVDRVARAAAADARAAAAAALRRSRT